MKRSSLVTSVLIALLTFSIAIVSDLRVYAQTEGSPLIVNFSYASQKIRKGEVWKVYLSVSDPEWQHEEDLL